jgi:putative SOS response-associated peptidase YedK
MAGLWEAWDSPEGILETFTIITTSPNELVRSVHDRMPVILSQDEGEVWLEAGRQDLLRSAPDDYLVKTAELNKVTEGCFDFMGSVSNV